MLGELALLGEGVRSAGARARRDTELLELRQEAFERLIMEAPGFALGLTRALGAQLAASRAPFVAVQAPRAIAVVGLHTSAPTAELAEGLALALERYGTVARLRSGGMAAIEQAERDADRVVMCGGVSPVDAWTATLLREADVVIAVSRGSASEAWAGAGGRGLRGCELIVVSTRAADDVVKAYEPRQVQVVGDGAPLRAAVEALGRRLAGRAVGIVFSGGGARAFAHLGVFEELTAAGMRFDRVAGVSLGSVVAASVASGSAPDEIYELMRRGFVEHRPTNDYVPPAFSLVRGAKTRRLLTAAFADGRIEELPHRFFCLACDLTAREPVLHRTGPIVDAVYSSLAIPGVFPPVATADGRLLVDGGVLDNLPVERMARTGEGPVVAVDVTGRMGASGAAGRRGLIGGPIRKLLTGSEASIPRLGETIVRSVTVGSIDTVEAARRHADLVITPRSDAVGLMDWKSLPRVTEIGRQAVRDLIAQDPGALEAIMAGGGVG